MEINGKPLTQMTIADARTALLAGEVSVVELVTAHHARIDAFDQSGPALNAMVTVSDESLQVAEGLDVALRAGASPGSLFGVPVVVKDNLLTSGMPTSFGSKGFRDYRSARDATVVSNLRGAGAIVIGKTTMPDWASAWFANSSRSGWTKNPHALGHSAGGSSSGTAVGIAAGYAPIGLGTDTGSSIRLPAAFCNLVGLRPTPGLVSRDGCSPIVAMQDTIGPMARNVTDLTKVFDVLVGFDPADPLTHRHSFARRGAPYVNALREDSMRGKRLGVLRGAFAPDSVDTREVNRVMESALLQCMAGGATLVDVEEEWLPRLIERTFLYRFAAKRDLNNWLKEQPGVPFTRIEDTVGQGGFDPRIPLLSYIGDPSDDRTSSSAFHAAIEAREELLSRLVGTLEANQLDAFVFPTTQSTPPVLGDVMDPAWNTVDGFLSPSVLASSAGMPALSIPAGFSSDGLPVGMEILGRPFDELTVISVAYGFEQLGSHHHAPVSTPAF
jgi:Asp-tRNA(Asn)/Glu-tRNA(Gln) amidotransferase A subunit family amidase